MEQQLETTNWTNIRIRRKTLKRLRVSKAENDLPVFDDVINLALDEIDKKKRKS
jgi:hypothetical protein